MKTVRDAVGRVTRTYSGVGTSSQREEKTSYTPNGLVETVTDGNGNLTRQAYDGFDRATVTYYPAPATPGSWNANDYQQLTYDENGNVTSLRKRDNQVITYSYDALDRMVLKDMPGGTNMDVSYDYDLRGLLTGASWPGDPASSMSMMRWGG